MLILAAFVFLALAFIGVASTSVWWLIGLILLGAVGLVMAIRRDDGI